MYIRTENRIYQVESTLRDNGFVKGYNVGEMAFIRKDQVLKQSEKLEELCDMTIVVDYERPDIVFELEWGIDKELLRKCEDVEGVYVYGAIWTSKGLIYVAKMNENGELALI